MENHLIVTLDDGREIDAGAISGGTSEETDPIFTRSPAHNITNNDITNWNNKSNFSGNYNDLSNKPTIPTELSELNNDEGFITEDDIPPFVTELGNIDAEDYEDELAMFMNTLTESGLYHFFWDNGDGFEYIIRVEAIPSEDNTYVEVNQHYWGTEEGPIAEYIRAITLEDGEVTEETDTSYMTFEGAFSSFASKSHVHYRTVQKELSVWDYCSGNEMIIQTDAPILYTDTRTPRHQWLIETTTTLLSPIIKFIRVTDLSDASVIYQRYGTYSAGNTSWGDWYKFSGTVFTP